MKPLRFLPPPYTFIENVDVSIEGWSAPKNIVVCELRCVAALATQNFFIAVRTEEQNNDKLLKGRGENIWRLQITSIRRFGTTPEVRTNCIEVYGYYKDQISQIIG